MVETSTIHSSDVIDPAAFPSPPTLGTYRLPGLLRAMRNDIVPELHGLFRRFGPTVRAYLPGVMDVVFVSRAADAERVFVTRQDTYTKGDEYDIPALGLRSGLVTSRGERWQRDRKLINPIFTKRRLDPFATTMTNCTVAMGDRWDGLADGSTVSISQEMMRVTLEIAAETMFGTDLTESEIDLTGAAITEALEDMLIIGASPSVWLKQALPNISVGQAAQSHRRNKRIQRRLRQLDAIIQRRIDTRNETDNIGEDFLGMLLGTQRDSDTMTHSEVMAQAVTFLGAGHETTGSGLSWFWHLMAQNPEARQRMLDEIDDVLGGRRPTAADFDRLPWTKACFSEALRIHPPVYLAMRRAGRDDVLGGYRVRAGSIVVVLTHEVHRDPAIWPEPHRFDPARFLPGAGKERPRGAYIPFGGGRRICIGSQFAMMEGTLIAAATSQRYVFDAKPGWKVVEEGVTTLRPKGGLPMILRRRTDAPPLVEDVTP